MPTLFDYSLMLQDVSYKPGWKLTLRDAGSGFVTLEVQASVINSLSPHNPMSIAQSYHFQVNDWANADRFFAFVRSCIKRVEKHECNEWFRVGGEPWPSNNHASF